MNNYLDAKKGTYPFKYLGIPMHYKRLNNKDWAMIEERIEKKLSSWKEKYLSVGGRLVLINSVLNDLPMFMLSIFEIPKGVLEKIDYLDRDSFDKMIVKKGSIGLLNRAWCTNRRTSEAMEFRIWRFKTNVC
jgi:hypothetical protein